MEEASFFKDWTRRDVPESYDVVSVLTKQKFDFCTLGDIASFCPEAIQTLAGFDSRREQTPVQTLKIGTQRGGSLVRNICAPLENGLIPCMPYICYLYD